MKPIQIISQDLFDKIRSRFTNLEMGDESGAVSIDPVESRFFDFDVVIENNNFGRVSISLNDIGSLKIYYSQGITENRDEQAKKYWYAFLKEMRLFAQRRLLRFDTRDIAKSNLNKNDFQHLATTQKPKEDTMSNMNESKWNQRSSTKTSRAVRGKTEVIVRHSKPVDEMYAGSRSQRKNIKSIFIQNRDGERFKYPFIHTAGAFAMAQHVDHGGIPHDPAGKAIIRMSEHIAKLHDFQRHVHRSSLHDDAMDIAGRAVGRLTELKAQIEALGKRHHYESWISEFNEPEDSMLEELDAVTMETYKQKFTQTNFKEELASFFPLIHSIMQEKIDLDEYVKESNHDAASESSDVGVNEFAQFEQWAEDVEQGKLTADQIAAFNDAKAGLINGQLDLGDGGENAWNWFIEAMGMSDQNLDDGSQESEAFNNLKSDLEAASKDPAANGMDVIASWATLHGKTVFDDSDLQQLGMLPAQPMASEPAPDQTQPAAEPAPATVPTGENTEMQMPPGVAEGNGAMMKDIAETVMSFYNADNESVAPIKSPESICLEVEKKYGPKAGVIAEKFMEKLTKKWEAKHRKHVEELAPTQETDGLAQLKDSLRRIKSKVEGIGDRGEATEEFSVNIMSAEAGPDKSQIPAYKRKEKGGNWNMSTADLENERDQSPTTDAGLAKKQEKLGMKPKQTELEDIMRMANYKK